jgi:hypothetical protein
MLHETFINKGFLSFSWSASSLVQLYTGNGVIQYICLLPRVIQHICMSTGIGDAKGKRHCLYGAVEDWVRRGHGWVRRGHGWVRRGQGWVRRGLPNRQQMGIKTAPRHHAHRLDFHLENVFLYI